MALGILYQDLHKILSTYCKGDYNIRRGGGVGGRGLQNGLQPPASNPKQVERSGCGVYCGFSQVDRIWGIWGSYYNIPKAIFYLLKGDYRARVCLGFKICGLQLRV